MNNEEGNRTIKGEMEILLEKIKGKSILEVVKVKIDTCKFILRYLNFFNSVKFNCGVEMSKKHTNLYHNRCIASLCFLTMDTCEGIKDMVLGESAEKINDIFNIKRGIPVPKDGQYHMGLFMNSDACGAIFMMYDYIRDHIVDTNNDPEQIYRNPKISQTMSTIKDKLNYLNSFAYDLIKLERMELNLNFESGKKCFPSSSHERKEEPRPLYISNLPQKHNTQEKPELDIPLDIRLLHAYGSQKKYMWIKYDYVENK